MAKIVNAFDAATRWVAAHPKTALAVFAAVIAFVVIV
jgi:hypothetical protein